MIELINKKKNKEELTKEEINYFVSNLKTIPDYQIAALLMAITINGMSDEETANLTKAMAYSGDVLDHEDTVDKHSTGGIGDKVTFVVAPVLASLGIKVGKMSGRGLGYTGGTIDKLESVHVKTTLKESEFEDQLEKINIAIISQTKNIAPADKILYHLRDVTATTESIPLITSSIMSKKIASGAKNLVLDVKVGNGAFMKSLKDAKKLAENMISIAKICNINAVAVLTNMDHPLGYNVGNTLEVLEAIDILKGKDNSAAVVSKTIASHMVSLYKNIDYQKALELVNDEINSGRALDKFKEFVYAQGGNFDIKNSKYKKDIYADRDGYISYSAINVGKCSYNLGAGRSSYEDEIDFEAGIVLTKETNDFVKTNDLIATLYSNSEITENFKDCYTIGDKINNQLIYEVIK